MAGLLLRDPDGWLRISELLAVIEPADLDGQRLRAVDLRAVEVEVSPDRWEEIEEVDVSLRIYSDGLGSETVLTYARRCDPKDDKSGWRIGREEWEFLATEGVPRWRVLANEMTP